MLVFERWMIIFTNGRSEIFLKLKTTRIAVVIIYGNFIAIQKCLCLLASQTERDIYMTIAIIYILYDLGSSQCLKRQTMMW